MNLIETVFDFKALSMQQQSYFFEKIYQFDQKIFPNSSLEEFKAFVYDPDAIAVMVIQYHDRDQVVGQNVIPFILIHYNEQPMHVVNSRAGFLSEYQKQNLTIPSAVKAMLNRRLKNPFIPLWFVISINQPKIYSLFASRSKSFFQESGKLCLRNIMKFCSLWRHGILKFKSAVKAYMCMKLILQHEVLSN